MDGSHKQRQAQPTVVNPNTAKTAYGLQVSHREAGSTLQGKSQLHFGVVKVVQHRMDTRYVLR